VLVIGPSTWTAVSLASASAQTLPSAGLRSAATASFGGFQNQGPQGFVGGFPSGGLPGGGRFAGGGFPGGAPPSGNASGGFGGSAGGAAGPGGSVSQALLTYLEQHQATAKYLFATLDANSAAPAILATGKPVMALGGLTGSDPILTLDALKALIRDGTVRYFVVSGRVGGGFGGFAGAGQQSSTGSLVSWIMSTCAPVTASGLSASGVYDCAGTA
jgi:hypothetical protein